MRDKLYKIKKSIINYGHFPRISLSTYVKLMPILALLLNYIERKYFLNNALLKFYPLRKKGTYFEHPLYPTDDGYAYYLQYYKQLSDSTAFLGSKEMAYYKGELLHGKMFKAQEEFNASFEHKSVLPVSIVSGTTKKIPSINTLTGKNHYLDIQNNSRAKERFYLNQNRYHYLPFSQGDKVKIKCNTDYIIGKALPVEQLKKTDKKLVLLLFCDNFAAKILKDHPLKELMPKTDAFFSKGQIFNNHHINGHWTLDSVPTFFTGKYPIKHKMYHPLKPQNIGENSFLISEAYQESGYMTFHIGGNQRVAPNFGYCKGFDRVVYGRHQPCEELIAEALDQVKAFPDRSQFGFITFMDLHNIMDHDIGIFSQTNASLKSRNFVRKKTETVSGTSITQFDEHFDELYRLELKRVDRQMESLYAFIESSYEEDEFLVALVSDHGYHSLGENDKLSKSKTTVPFMIRGGVTSGVINDFTCNMDVFPSLLYNSGIKYSSNIDGVLPVSLGGDVARKSVYAEAIYPNQPYTAKIIDDKFTYMFYSSITVGDDGVVNLNRDSYSCILTDDNGVDVTQLYHQQVDKYTESIFQHTSLD